jgi:hypothetical protein
MNDPTSQALADLARAIGVKPRLTKEERAARRAIRRARAESGTVSARARRNRDLGIPRPTPGTRLIVRSAPMVPNRRRCGIDFAPTAPLSFVVSTYARPKCEELRAAGEAVISEDEAEQLLADTMLIAMPLAATEPDHFAAREEALRAREREVAAREAELAKAAEDAKAKPQAQADEAAAKAKAADDAAKAKAAEDAKAKDEKKDKPKG